LLCCMVGWAKLGLLLCGVALAAGAAAPGAETCKAGACGEHVLTYFPSPRAIPAGRGEAVRIALHAAGIETTSKFLIYSEYQELKANTNDHAWKNGLPILSVAGKDFTQSLAALRYAGKKSNLYPTDHLEALAVDEILDIVQDILTKAPQDPDEAAKLTKRAEYATTGKMHSLVSLLNKRAEQDPSTPWMVGSDLTVADLCLYFGLFKMLRDGDFDGVAKGYIDSWPALAALEAAVPNHPVFTGFYESKK